MFLGDSLQNPLFIGVFDDFKQVGAHRNSSIGNRRESQGITFWASWATMGDEESVVTAPAKG
jgi:hypothetical protein